MQVEDTDIRVFGGGASVEAAEHVLVLMVVGGEVVPLAM